MKKERLFAVAIVVGLISAVLVACSGSASPPSAATTSKETTSAPAAAKKAEPIVLKAVTFSPKNHVAGGVAFTKFQEKINRLSNGEVVIEYLGGPEVIPVNEQPEAVANNVVQMIQTPVSYYKGMVGPEVDVLHLSRVGLAEERKPGGFRDFLADLIKKGNMQFLGRFGYTQPFYLYVTKEIKTPEEIAGLKLRTTPVYNIFLQKLKAVPVNTNVSEIYLAMQTGVVDGYFMGPGIADLGLQEVTKYRVDHGFYSSNITVNMNLKVWESLPPRLQTLFKDTMLAQEDEWEKWYVSEQEKDADVMRKGGVKFISFSPSDAERYVNLAYDVYWDALQGQLKPDVYQKVRSLLAK